MSIVDVVGLGVLALVGYAVVAGVINLIRARTQPKPQGHAGDDSARSAAGSGALHGEIRTCPNPECFAANGAAARFCCRCGRAL